jgi:hypothetical protein
MKTLIALYAMALCVVAQDQPNTNSLNPKPSEIGQIFCLKDGKLTPLHEETKIYASYTFTYDINVKISGAESATELFEPDRLKFLIHLPDKSVGSYVLYTLKKERDKRTMRVGETQRKVLFSTIEYADGYFQITPKTPLAPGQYVFFAMADARNADHFYSFSIK